jgi:hypothetical protein
MSIYYLLKQLYHVTCDGTWQSNHLHPFGEIIDREQNMTIPRWSFQQRALMIDSDGVEWNIMKLTMDA